MNGQHISVIIADRPYRLKVNNEHEEEQFRKAGKLINEKLQEYARHFAFRDKRDLLAMVVLQFAVDFLKSKQAIDYQDELKDKLNDIDQLLDIYLSE